MYICKSHFCALHVHVLRIKQYYAVLLVHEGLADMLYLKNAEKCDVPSSGELLWLNGST